MHSESSKPTLLIVDDTPVNVAVLADHLVSYGFSVIITHPDRKNLQIQQIGISTT